MNAGDISSVIGLVFQLWLGALTLVVLTKILRGDINTHGLLQSQPDGSYDGERVTLVFLTLITASYYVIHVIGTPLDAMRLGDPDHPRYILPDIPDELVALFGGSQVAYITGKIFRPVNRG